MKWSKRVKTKTTILSYEIVSDGDEIVARLHKAQLELGDTIWAWTAFDQASNRWKRGWTTIASVARKQAEAVLKGEA